MSEFGVRIVISLLFVVPNYLFIQAFGWLGFPGLGGPDQWDVEGPQSEYAGSYYRPEPTRISADARYGWMAPSENAVGAGSSIEISLTATRICGDGWFIEFHDPVTLPAAGETVSVHMKTAPGTDGWGDVSVTAATVASPSTLAMHDTDLLDMAFGTGGVVSLEFFNAGGHEVATGEWFVMHDRVPAGRPYGLPIKHNPLASVVTLSLEELMQMSCDANDTATRNLTAPNRHNRPR